MFKCIRKFFSDGQRKKFKLGDRVVLLCYDSARPYRPAIDSTGTVVNHKKDIFDNILYGVRFDNEFPHGGDLGGRCEVGYGLWCEEWNLKLQLEDYSTRKLLLEDLNNSFEFLSLKELERVQKFVKNLGDESV